MRKTGQDIKTIRFPIRVGQPTVIKPTTTEIMKTTNGINTAPMTRGPSTYSGLFWIKKYSDQKIFGSKIFGKKFRIKKYFERNIFGPKILDSKKMDKHIIRSNIRNQYFWIRK